MNSAKKIDSMFEDPMNERIQSKFDLVFSSKEKTESAAKNSNAELFDDDNEGMNFDVGDTMEKKQATNDSIGLDFSIEEDIPKTPAQSSIPKEQPKAPAASAPRDDGLDFSINFNMADAEFESAATVVVTREQLESTSDKGLALEEIDVEEFSMEGTQRTIVINKEAMSSDHMSTEEARVNIESTIKDILRPNLNDIGGGPDTEDSVLDFGGNTPATGFLLDNNNAFGMDSDEVEATVVVKAPSAKDYGLESFGLANGDNSPAEEDDFITAALASKKFQNSNKMDSTPAPSMGLGGSMNTEDSMRFQATIRALREEREDFLTQIKLLKTNGKELEQDNLTMKANLDEAKIEITILRKRHMVEVEDLKYRLGMSEEKKLMADEKARQADLRREKLEQKVRIDFNQVKQREKELESKLELLSMDVDSQVQSRDHKILELRRKIDALEFNMENTSIKEQKSLDDKRKLEDRLNKIMKTLRNSIKNLEDDIDHAQEDGDHQKEKN